MLLLKWFLSGAVRHAMEMRRHVRNILRAQQDLLAPPAIAAVEAASEEVLNAARSGDKKAIGDKMTALEEAANKWLKPYPHAAWRENVEVFLVAIAVALGVRTFFVQPFKIPTGSMQPTLYGITGEDLKTRADFKMPDVLTRYYESWVKGISYFHVVAKNSGAVNHIQPIQKFLLFNLFQKFNIGNQTYTIWFPSERLLDNDPRNSLCGWGNGTEFLAGDDVMFMKIWSGDFLFVDRVSYNFRHPRRGDIVVFQTAHIRHEQVPTNQFYIKRLVGLGGETLSISPRRHLVVNGQELSASTPHFERLYGSDGDYQPNHYYGHTPIQLFANGQEYPVPPKHFLVMGDNTVNSLDSRYWGAIPREDVIGKEFFVFWPISDRFGWGYR